jgi:hypothetical protein
MVWVGELGRNTYVHTYVYTYIHCIVYIHIKLGWTALKVARDKHHDDVAAILQAASGEVGSCSVKEGKKAMENRLEENGKGVEDGKKRKRGAAEEEAKGGGGEEEGEGVEDGKKR